MVTAQKIGQQGQNAKPMGCGQSTQRFWPDLQSGKSEQHDLIMGTLVIM